MIGTFELTQTRPGEGIIKEIVKRNTIDTTTAGLKYKIINNFTQTSGNAGIYLNPNFSHNSFSTNAGVLNDDGIFAISPILLGTYASSEPGETEDDFTICFNVSQTEDEATSTKARWKGKVQWIDSEFDETISSLDSTSNYITTFKLGKNFQKDGTDFNFVTPFSSVTLSGSDRVQPALNDIIDVTWTIEVS